MSRLVNAGQDGTEYDLGNAVILIQFNIYFNTFEIRNTIRRLVRKFKILVVLLLNF